MITGNNDFFLADGDEHIYRSDVEVHVAIVVDVDENVVARVSVFRSTGTQEPGGIVLVYDFTTINAQSSAESGASEVFKNKVEKCVVDSLEAVAYNSGVTFTIS